MTSYRPDPIAYLTGRLSKSARPEAITAPGENGKFTSDGQVLPFPGNTILCHIDPASEAFSALCDMQAALKAGPHARHFVFLPAASFHMTVFQGVSGAVPRLHEWPKAIPLDMPLDEISRTLIGRLERVSVPDRFIIRTLDLFGGYSLTVEGATQAQEVKLMQTRAALRDATGITPPDFERYTFHITLAYLLDWLDESAARDVVAFSEQLHAAFAGRVPEIVLGAPEFCQFENMFHFERLALLGGTAGRRSGGAGM